VGDSAAVEDISCVVSPHATVASGGGGRDGRLGVFGIFGNVVFNLCILIGLDSICTHRHKGCAEGNTGNLCSEQELFALEEEGVGEDFLIQVTGELNANSSRGLKVLGLQVGKKDPVLCLRVVGHPVRVNVDTLATLLDISSLCNLSLGFSFGGGSISGTLSDVIIGTSSTDFTPETHVGGTGFRA